MIKLDFIKNKGRGIIAKQNIGKEQILFKCPVLIISKDETEIIRKTILGNYIFDWPSENQNSCSLNWTSSAICLGLGSLINHSDNPNIDWQIHRESLEISFISIKDIKKDEELTFNYNWGQKKKKNENIL